MAFFLLRVVGFRLLPSTTYFSNGLQPKPDGLHPSSDGLQPTRDGLQPNTDGLQSKTDGLQTKSDGLQPERWLQPKSDGLQPKRDDLRPNSSASNLLPPTSGLQPNSNGLSHALPCCGNSEIESIAVTGPSRHAWPFYPQCICALLSHIPKSALHKLHTLHKLQR